MVYPDDIRKKRGTMDSDRVQGQIDRGEVDASPDDARKIAKKIENQGGFWGPRKGK